MIHPSVKIAPTARIACDDITIGEGGVVGAGCVVEGTRVVVGRELWMDEGARIGGGSCRDPQAFLKAGDWLHLGKGSEINIARGVTLGDEVGVGVGTSLFTHGAYLDEIAGFPCAFAPIKVGSRVWLPNAWINPGVTIGDDVVVAARSLVNRDLPSGCLAGGAPAKVLRENAYPRALPLHDKVIIMDHIVAECRALGTSVTLLVRPPIIEVIVDGATFDVVKRTLRGEVTRASEVVRNQLRRHGIRFRSSPSDGEYETWDNVS